MTVPVQFARGRVVRSDSFRPPGPAAACQPGTVNAVHGIGGGVRSLMVAGVIGSAVLVSGCAQSGAGASEPDEATQLAMETCGIEVVEGDGTDGDAEGSRYARSVFGSGEGPWDAIESDLERLESLEESWRDRAISSRAASQLDDQWDDLSEWHAENYEDLRTIVLYRESDKTPTYKELSSRQAAPTSTFNANLNRIRIECAALVRTLPDPS